MDAERLKNGGTVLTEQYFEEQIEKIREIRLSERKFYQKITDIYATALDYDRTAKTTKEFLLKYKIRCTLLFMGTLPQRSSIRGQTPRNRTWSDHMERGARWEKYED